MADAGRALVCPGCGREASPPERFCPDCGMPLTFRGGGEAPVSDRQARARKVRAQYTEGDLVRVAHARHQAEAELIQGVLLEEGIPSMLRRTRGFDVPDMLAAGPRDVLVPASGAAAARQALLQEALPVSDADGARPGVDRAVLWVLALVALVAIVALIGMEVVG
jgi:predicted amidophosphoribosyltransferase